MEGDEARDEHDARRRHAREAARGEQARDGHRDPAAQILDADRATRAFASGGVDAWIAGSVADGGAFYGVSALALGASKVREAVDEAKGEMRTRTPRFARIAPSGKLAVSIGMLGPDPTTYAYAAVWQRGTDEVWRLLFFTLVLPQ